MQQEPGLDVDTLAEGCFVYAISRLIRDDPPLALQTLSVALPSSVEDDEAACRQVWNNAEDKIHRTGETS